MDYCTRPVVRERRVHRRLAVHRRPSSTARSSSSWSATAASAAGPTASGTRSSPASPGAPPQSFPSPPYTTLDHEPGVAREAVPLRRRATALSASSSPTRSSNSSGTTWAERPDAGPLDPDRELLRGQARPTASTINDALLAGQEPALHAGHLRRRPDDRGQARRTPSCSASAWRRSTRANGVVADDGRRRPASRSPGSSSTPGPVNSPVLLQVGSRTATAAAPSAATRTTRLRSTTSSSASAARTSARPRSASWSTATT